MSEEPQRSSHAAAWSFGVVGALLLYVLSVGPVIFTLKKAFHLPTAPRWFATFYAPLVWLDQNTPLKKPLDAYAGFWEHLADRP